MLNSEAASLLKLSALGRFCLASPAERPIHLIFGEMKSSK